MTSYVGMSGIELFLTSFWPMMKAGFLYSIPMMLLSFVLGLIVALFVALGRMSRFKPLSLLCAGQRIPAGLSLQRRRDTTAAAGPAFFQGLSL